MTTNTPNETQSSRGQWSGRLGFIAAAAGSSIGLGNIWKFPYITGENGGGAFVLVYLLCILLIAAPILIAEILIGRASQKGAVGAFPNFFGTPLPHPRQPSSTSRSPSPPALKKFALSALFSTHFGYLPWY